jgi:hypothetical protein
MMNINLVMTKLDDEVLFVENQKKNMGGSNAASEKP